MLEFDVEKVVGHRTTVGGTSESCCGLLTCTFR